MSWFFINIIWYLYMTYKVYICISIEKKEKKQYGRNWYKNMSEEEEEHKLNAYRKNHRNASNLYRQ